MKTTNHRVNQTDSSPEPLISFIIPLLNHLDQSKEMLDSLLKTVPRNLDYEIILADDGSTDGTKEWLRRFRNQNIHVLFNETNLGYAKTNNRAARIAKGKILGFLNNDLILLDGWLEPMLEILRSPTICAGIVGNIQHRVDDDAIDHAGIQVSHLAKIEHIREIPATDIALKRTFAVTGACCLVWKKDFLDIGGFDEMFQNGGEDVDLCLKLRTLSKHAYIATRSRVKHHVSLTRDRTSNIHERNSRLLFSKWKPIILQETKNAWMKLLTTPPEASNPQLLADFHLKKICRETPHAASLILASSVLLREETRWREILDANQSTIDQIRIEKFEGFQRDDDFPYPWINTSAWILLPIGSATRNFFISGEMLEKINMDQQSVDGNEIIIEINGLQARCWKNLTAGHFNLGIERPISSPHHPTIVSITINFETEKNQSSPYLPASAWKIFRFSHIIIDDRIALDLSAK